MPAWERRERRVENIERERAIVRAAARERRSR